MCTQVWSYQQQWWQEMATNFLSVTWLGETLHELGVQDAESLILVDVLFLLDGGRRREGK
jgi:hypothetical protein